MAQPAESLMFTSPDLVRQWRLRMVQHALPDFRVKWSGPHTLALCQGGRLRGALLRRPYLRIELTYPSPDPEALFSAMPTPTRIVGADKAAATDEAVRVLTKLSLQQINLARALSAARRLAAGEQLGACEGPTAAEEAAAAQQAVEALRPSLLAAVGGAPIAAA